MPAPPSGTRAATVAEGRRMTDLMAGAALLLDAVGARADPSQLLPAREQMAFTLGFHIILVPFGVAFTFLMLIANTVGSAVATPTPCCSRSGGRRCRPC